MSDAARFLAAIRRGDLAAVGSADPDPARSRDASGVPVVCLAVYLGREPIARALARVRADLDLFEASTIGDARRVRDRPIRLSRAV